jgi:hypothetical protein
VTSKGHNFARWLTAHNELGGTRSFCALQEDATCAKTTATYSMED